MIIWIKNELKLYVFPLEVIEECPSYENCKVPIDFVHTYFDKANFKDTTHMGSKFLLIPLQMHFRSFFLSAEKSKTH